MASASPTNSSSEAEMLAAGLRAGAAAWASAGLDRRIAVLEQWRQVIANSREDIVSALVEDTGRTALSYLEVDSVMTSITRMSTWARDVFADPQPMPSSDPDVSITQVPVPFELVGVISPWNFPFQLALIDAVPALLAGASVLIKPSEITPHVAGALRCTVEAVPDLKHVLGVIEGGPEVGAQIVGLVDAVCFTGSVRTGKLVARAAAEHFIPAFLELGGKDAAIVAEGADLDIASSGILWGSTANTGQSCMSLERVYVEESIAKEFTELLVAKAASVRLVCDEPPGEVGPFIDRRQATVVEGQLADAKSRGATIRTGGVVEVHAGRSYLRPTVITHATPDMEVMSEETFGPVISIATVKDMDEAVSLANATRYGLSGAVFAAPGHAEEIAVRLDAGGISINDACLTGLVPDGEKQAFKDSGLGPSRMGPASLRRFVRQRVLLTRRTPQIQPWWYRDDLRRGQEYEKG